MKQIDWIYRTNAHFYGHLGVGTFLLFAMVPLSALDIILAPDWYALHPMCDSLGLPVFSALFVSPIWLALSALFAALLCHFCVKNREGGQSILKLRFRPSILGVVAHIAFAALVYFILADAVGHVLTAGKDFTFTTDCGGRAEEMTVTRTKPFLQILPFWSLLLGLWLPHIRCLAISPKHLDSTDSS